MKNIISYKCIVILVSILVNFSFQNPINIKTGNLKVVVINMRNGQGQVGFFLYKSSDGFPNHFNKSIMSAYVKTNAASTEYTFLNVPMGTYAVCVFHDENNDKTINSNFIGMPKEGIGVSNNAKGHFGPPKYDDAKFILDKQDQTITISLKYL
jgi:uncharacterized protein (DUF2141 family)